MDRLYSMSIILVQIWFNLKWIHLRGIYWDLYMQSCDPRLGIPQKSVRYQNLRKIFKHSRIHTYVLKVLQLKAQINQIKSNCRLFEQIILRKIRHRKSPKFCGPQHEHVYYIWTNVDMVLPLWVIQYDPNMLQNQNSFVYKQRKLTYFHQFSSSSLL